MSEGFLGTLQAKEVLSSSAQQMMPSFLPNSFLPSQQDSRARVDHVCRQKVCATCRPAVTRQNVPNTWDVSGKSEKLDKRKKIALMCIYFEEGYPLRFTKALS